MYEIKAEIPKEIRLEICTILIDHFVIKNNSLCINHDGICSYTGKAIGKSTLGCAVGIFLPEIVASTLDRFLSKNDNKIYWQYKADCKNVSDFPVDSSINHIFDSELIGMLPKKLVMAGRKFLREIQIIHDSKYNKHSFEIEINNTIRRIYNGEY